MKNIYTPSWLSGYAWWTGNGVYTKMMEELYGPVAGVVLRGMLIWLGPHLVKGLIGLNEKHY